MSNVVEGNFPTKTEELIHCSFCGQPEREGLPIVSNRTVNICGECIKLCYDLVEDTMTEAEQLDRTFSKKTPSKIVQFLNEYVIGQDKAKRTLALAIYNHYKRIKNPIHKDVELAKSNVLMIGPSGSGKTYLVQTIARFLDIPFAIADATSLSATGWVGDDVETVLQRLIQAAGGDVKKAEYGIVYIDEIDKVAKKSLGASHSKDPAGEGVQQGLLKIIEGTKSRVPKEGGRKVSSDSMDMIDTTHILFICGGAFVDLDKVIDKRSNTTQTGMGFTSNVDKAPVVTRDPEPEDLYEYGFIPELVGRLPVICTLTDLDQDALAKILVEPKNSVIKQFQALAAMDDAEIEFTKEAILTIAKMAQDRKTGARGLRSVVEGVLNDTMFKLPDYEPGSKIMVSAKNGEVNIKVRQKKGAQSAN